MAVNPFLDLAFDSLNGDIWEELAHCPRHPALQGRLCQGATLTRTAQLDLQIILFKWPDCCQIMTNNLINIYIQNC